VFSDFFSGFFIINAYLIAGAIAIRWLDGREHLVDLMPWDDYPEHDQNEHVLRAFKHHKATYFFSSLVLNLFMIMLVASWNYFFTCTVTVYKVKHTMRNYYRDLNLLKLVLLVVVFIFLKLFVGVFVALLSMVAWMQKAATRHVHILEKKKIANEFTVVDLEKAGRLKYKLLMDSESVSASAPPESHHLASSKLLDSLRHYKIA
jgi:MFS superfamily sulfate permease-like transporter